MLLDPERLAAVGRTALLDTPPEPGFERLTRLAARLLSAPVALVSLVDDRRQFLKSNVGLPEPWASRREMPLSHSFCRYAVASGEPLVVHDSREHPLMRECPAVHDPGVIAYLGIPLFDARGHALGSFCVIDREPRAWTEEEIEVVRDLAHGVMTEIALRADIAERRRVELQLERERAFVGAVLNTLEEGIAACDAEGRLTLFNPASRALHGLPPEPIPSERWAEHYDLFASDGTTRLTQEKVPLFRALRGEAVERVEIVIAPQGREPRIVRSSGRQLRDADGQLLGAVVAMHDVTEQHRADAALRASEERYRLLFQSNPNPMWVYDTETLRFLAVNEAAVRHYGYPAQAWADMTIRDIRRPEDLPVLEEVLAAHPGRRGGWHALRHLRRDGAVLEVEVTSAPIRFGDRPARLVSVKDVTDQVRVQQALRESEERFRGLVESASDMIYRADLNGHFTYVNPVASREIGIPAAAITGMHFTELVREDAREETLAFYAEQIRGRVATTYFEFPARTADGRDLWVGQNVQLVYQGERLVGIQAVARNITAQREVERFKDELISVISHELRTPLTAMRGALGLLAGGQLGSLDHRGHRMLEIAAHNADRLVRLINDILDMERMSAGAVALERRAVDAATLMEDAVATMRPMAERAGVQLLHSPLFAKLVGDPDRLVQALTNLLSNAIKFSPERSVVWLTAVSTGDEVVFCVRDRGRGIPLDKQALVFERFQQVDSSDSRVKGGSGLGLAICRGIVEQHGGRLWVESQWGEGSSFYLAVPGGTLELVGG